MNNWMSNKLQMRVEDLMKEAWSRGDFATYDLLWLNFWY